MIFKNDNNKEAGELKNNIYRSVRQGSKHLMKIFDAWGIDKKIISILEREKCKEIRILDKETCIVYFTSLSSYKEHGIIKNFDGEQVFLPRKWFETKNTKQPVLA